MTLKIYDWRSLEELINKSRIFYLRKTNAGIELQSSEVINPYSEIVQNLTLKRKRQQISNIECLELIKNSEMAHLMVHFNYCKVLSAPFQGVKNIPFMAKNVQVKSFLESYSLKYARLWIGKFDSLGKEKKDYWKNNIQNGYVNQVVESLPDRALAKSLELKYEELSRQDDVIFFSHQRLGWKNKPAKISKDLSIEVNTNFGYGRSSYFYLVIEYKGIRIVPYSDWVTYRFVEARELQKYTKKYPLRLAAWVHAFNHTIEYESLCRKTPNLFIQEKILNEVKQLVENLEKFAVDGLSENPTFIKNYESDIFSYVSYDHLRFRINHRENVYYHFEDHYDKIHVYAEKLSGALTFLTDLRKLESLFDEIPDLILRIVESNKTFLPLLELEVEKIEKDMENVEVIINTNTSKVELLQSEVAKLKSKYQPKIDVLENELTKKGISRLEIKARMAGIIERQFPDLVEKENELLEEEKNLLYQTDKLAAYQKQHQAFVESHDVIMSYFDQE